LANGISLSGGDMTVLELVEKYLEQKRNVRPTTAAGYKTVVNVLKRDIFGSQKINHINTIDAKAWLIKLQSEDGKSYSSVHTIRGVVRPAFQMAYEADLIRKNPFDFELHNFLIDDSVKRDAVTSKQEKEFLKFVQQDEHFSECYDGMFILFRTGLRIGEFCGLTLKDIDLEKRTINVNHQLQYVGNRGKYIEKTKTEAGT
jgi:site-specific recombinase XerD